MKGPLKEFEKGKFIGHLESSKAIIYEAAALGRKLSEQYEIILLVGCGAPNRIARLINHFVNNQLGVAIVYSYLPAELIHIDPAFVNEKTVAVFGSYSGTTTETVEAAKYCKDKKCKNISITRFNDSLLSSQVDYMLNFGDSQLGDYPLFMIETAFVTGFLSSNEEWKVHDDILDSLHALPEVLSEAVMSSEKMIEQFSNTYHHLNSIFIVGNGPIYNIAYMLALCSFLEMFKIHATPIIAADFFHGPFELLDDSFPVIVLIGEDETREEGLRVKRFCENYLENYLIVDSTNYPMEGIPEKLRGFFSSVVLDAATRRFMDYYQVLRKEDRTARRYMGKVDY